MTKNKLTEQQATTKKYTRNYFIFRKKKIVTLLNTTMFAYSNIFISSSAPTTSATCQREREREKLKAEK